MSSATRQVLEGFRRSRHWMNQLLGRDVHVPIQVRCRHELLGSSYGGWCLCPDRITAESLVYSFGVGKDITWDLAMIDRFGVQVHAFDPTPKSIAWIRRQSLPPAFHFHELGIATYDGVARFALPRPDFISYSMSLPRSRRSARADTVEAPVRRLSTLMEMLGHAGRPIDVLKMDVEGTEIDVIEQLPELGIECRQLLVEFHHRLGDAAGVRRTRAAIETLNRNGYRLFFNSAVGREYAFLH